MVDPRDAASLRAAIAGDAAYRGSLLKELVRRPSPTGRASGAIDVLETEMRACELECWRFKPDLEALRGAPQFQEPVVAEPGIENVAGRLACDRPPGLLLFSHFDTEPADNSDALSACDR